MKLGIISNNFPPEIIGGAEVYAKQLSNELSNYQDLFVFAGRYHLDRKLSSYHITTHVDSYSTYRIELGAFALDYRNPLNFFDPFVEAKFKKIIGKEKPEILHTHNLAGISLSPVAYTKKELKIPVIMTLHDFWLICPKNTLLMDNGDLCKEGGNKGCNRCSACFFSPISKISMNTRNKLVKRLSKNIDLFITPSKKMMDIMLDRGYDFEIHHLQNGLNIEKFYRIERSNNNEFINILMVGYISYHKGVYLLIDAIKSLLEMGYKNIRLILVGPIENADKLNSFIKAKKVEKYVDVMGKVSEQKKLELFKGADLFVLPSLWYENYPLTIIEAMASMLPVVGSNVGGIPEMIINGKTGYLFERGDSKDLSIKIEEIISAKKKMKDMGRIAREVAIKKFDIKEHTKKIIKIYEGLL